MTSLASVYVSVLPETKNFSRNLNRDLGRVDSTAAGRKVGDGFSKGFGSSAKKIAGIAGAAFAGVKIASFGKDVIALASNAEQSVGAIDSVFKKYAKGVQASSKVASTAVGLSSNSYRELATLIGSQLKNAGTSMDQLGPKTDSLIKQGADFAAMYGGSTKDAVAALSSALKGERDPIEKYGISLNENTIKAEALRLGLVKTTQDTGKVSVAQKTAELAQRKYSEAVSAHGKKSVQAQQAALGLEKAQGALEKAAAGTKGELSASAKATATLSAIQKQGADAAGTFARENDTAAHKAQVAGAKWEDLKTKLGTAVLPAFSAVTGFIGSKLIPGLERLSGWLGTRLTSGMAVIRPALDEVRGGFSAFVGAFRDGTDDITSNGFAGYLEALGVQSRNLFDWFRSSALPTLISVGATFLNIAQAALPVFLAALQGVWTVISGVVNFVRSNNTVFLALAAAIAGGAAAFGAITLAMNIANLAQKAYASGILFVKGVMATARVGIFLFNAALAANPIGIVVIALAALGSGLVLAYKKSETFRAIVDGAFRAVKGVAVGLFNWLKSNWPLLLAILTGPIGLAVFAIAKNWGRIKTAFSDSWAWIKAKVLSPMGNFITVTVPGFFSAGVDAVGRAWDKIKNIAKAPVKFVIETVLNKGLFGVINRIVGWLPGSAIKPISTSMPAGLAAGGRVPGHSPHKRADNIPIMATANEHMWSVDEVRGAGGHKKVSQLRQWAREGSLAFGGPVPGFAYGGALPGVTQAAVNFIRSRFPAVSSMGTWGRRANKSDHPKGLAIDAMVSPNHRSPDRQALGSAIASEFASNAGKHGTKYVIWQQSINQGSGWKGMENRGGDTANHFDHVHISFKGSGGGGIGGFFGGIGRRAASFLRDKVADAYGKASGVAKSLLDRLPGLSSGDGFGGAIKAAVSRPFDAIGDFLRGTAESGGDVGGGAMPGGSGVTRWSGVVLQALKEVGQPATLLSTVLRRMNQESGGNPNIVNNWDSNARRGVPSKGLMQVIAPTFAAYAGKYRSRGVLDPLANIYASMQYALARYGSLSSAYNRRGGYDTGGWLRSGNAAVNTSGRPERVLSPNQTASFDRLVSLLESNGAGAAGANGVSIKVFIGDREIKDIVGAEVDGRDVALADSLVYGRN